MRTETVCADALMDNYRVFERALPDLLVEYQGEYALVGAGQLEVFPSVVEALSAGIGRFVPGEFVVQEIVPLEPMLASLASPFTA